MTEQLNLGQLFDFVTQTLSAKREDLNAADTYNHDHGDHVVEVFEVVTQVAKEHPGLEAAEILDRASALLRQKQTGTARAYAQTMAQGAHRLKGKPVTQQTLPLLIEALLGSAPRDQQPTQPQPQAGDDLLGGLMGALMGGGQQPAQPQPQEQPGGDLLGGLMGALMGGGQQPAQPQPQEQPGGDLLGGLLGALMGGGGQQQGGLSDGLDMGDMLRAGGAFLEASQSGQSTTAAALSALAAATGVGQTPHRAQSSALVMQALLQAAQHMGGNK